MPELKDIDLKSISLEKSTLNIREEDVNNTLDDTQKNTRGLAFEKKRPAIM